MIRFLILSATELNVDPNIEKFFLVGMISVIVGGIFVAATSGVLQNITERKEEQKARRIVKFDPKKSVIINGSLRLDISAESLEYFICKAVFSNPNKYHPDLAIKGSADPTLGHSKRAIYQAVLRVNKKARETLEIDQDLLIRSRERTILNDVFNY